MKYSNRDIENMLSTAYKNITPSADCAAMSSDRPANQKVIEMSSARTRRQGWQYKVASLAAAFAIVFTGAFGYVSYNEHNAVDSIVDIDVNPSVELKLSKTDKVLEVSAANRDAEKVLSELDLADAELDDAIDMIIGAMVEYGYISEDANSVLISVSNKDEHRNEELKNMLSTEVEAVLRQRSIDPAIFSQSLRSKAAKPIAEQYGISIGKATLIQNIVKSDKSLNPGELSQLPVNDIILIAGSKAQNAVETVSGSASDKAYIGESTAKSIAANHAGSQNVQNLKVGMSIENGTMIYEVSFTVSGTPFAYDIDARTGAIIGFTGKPISNNQHNSSNNDTVPNEPEETPEEQGPVYNISSDDAKDIALSSLGITPDKAGKVSISSKTKDDRGYYEVRLTVGTRDYTYVIDGETGKIVMCGWQNNGKTPEEPAEPEEVPTEPPVPEKDPADKPQGNGTVYESGNEKTDNDDVA